MRWIVKDDFGVEHEINGWMILIDLALVAAIVAGVVMALSP
jgi:hypothetical protein